MFNNDKNSIISINSEGKENDIELRSFYVSAKEKLQNGNIEGAYKDFFNAKSILGCAYCLFISGKVHEASVLLNLIKNSNPAADWLLCLTGIIKGDIKQTPTYLQIRNFYEADLNMLLKYKNINFAKKIYKNINYFSSFNKEVLKYTARVFLDNNEIKAAIHFLKKSINLYYNDPEVHFMLAEAYFATGNKDEAKKEYEKADKIAEGYFPALKKLKEIEISKK